MHNHYVISYNELVCGMPAKDTVGEEGRLVWQVRLLRPAGAQKFPGYTGWRLLR